jgi:hypothetical protein
MTAPLLFPIQLTNQNTFYLLLDRNVGSPTVVLYAVSSTPFLKNLHVTFTGPRLGSAG